MNQEKDNKKICFVATAEFAVTAFLIQHLKTLSVSYDVTLLVNTDNKLFLTDYGLDIRVLPVKIFRKINFFYDALALLKIYIIFRRNAFDVVHTITPKAGLLGAIASFMARIPLRIHTFTGQVWFSKRGILKITLKFLDKLTGLLATHIIVDSPSQLEFLINQNIVKREKCSIFGIGSIAGVDFKRFKSNQSERKRLRAEFGLSENCILFIYLGRLSRDKGILDLAAAFSKVKSEEAYIFFVGPDEDSLAAQIESILENKRFKLRFIPFTKEPEKYLNCADVLCLPSYREGFGNVIIESAAYAIPAIASRIYGITDAIIDNQTGILHNPGDVTQISKHIQSLIFDQDLRIRLGLAAKSRVLKNFNAIQLSNQWLSFYNDLFSN